MVEYHEHTGNDSPPIQLKNQRGFPVIEGEPDFESRDGQIVFDSTNGRIYARINGAWVNMNPVPSNFEQTVPIVGSVSEGDIVFNNQTLSNSLIYQISGTGFSQADFGFNSTQKFAFRFKAPHNFTLTSVIVSLFKTGSPGDAVRIRLHSHDGGSNTPDAILGTVLQSVTTTPANYTLTFNQALTADAYYWIVFDRTGANDSLNYYSTFANDTSSITGATDIHPDAITKIANSGGSWADSGRPLGKFALYGDMPSGHHKWYGLRTNVNCGSIAGVVKSVSGSSAVIVTQGYMSGQSCTKGEIKYINGVGVGMGLSSTELFVFPRKYFLLLNKGYSGTGATTLNYPIGFPYTTSKVTNATLAPGTGSEILISRTGTGTASVSLTNEYTSIT